MNGSARYFALIASLFLLLGLYQQLAHHDGTALFVGMGLFLLALILQRSD